MSVAVPKRAADVGGRWTFEAVLFDWIDVDTNIRHGLSALSRHFVLLVTSWHGSVDELMADLGCSHWPGGLLAAIGGDVVELEGDLGGLGGTSSNRAVTPETMLVAVRTAGIDGSLIAAVGDGPWSGDDLRRVVVLPGGRATLRSLVEDQLRLRTGLAVPSIDEDPRWVLCFEDGGSRSRRVRETLCSVGDGLLGTRGSAEEEPRGSDPLVLMSGIYDDGDPPALLPAPLWTSLDRASGEQGGRWMLDMRGGLLGRSRNGDLPTLRTLRFASKARPGCVVLRVEQLRPTHGASPAPDGEGGVRRAAVSSRRGAIVSFGADRQVLTGDRIHLERIVAYGGTSGGRPDDEEVIARLAGARAAGSELLLAEHRRRWARIWNGAQVEIDRDPEMEVALRFGLYHLLTSVPEHGEAAVGARGLTGRAYQGHVFWDADVFVLPVMCAVAPEAARAMLEYRIRRLPAARRRAARMGYRGARFPWESANDGEDVTPTAWTDPEGNRVPIRTGLREEHITADVAWAALHYARWCGDKEFLRGPGRELVIDTARYWASRVRKLPDGRFHLLGVVGPDEYHEVVDDNAFTNVMARANLRWAIDLAGRGGAVGAGERSSWQRVASSLVDGYHAASGLYEQFAGYFDLEPLLIQDVAPPPVAADLLMGRHRVRATQIVKQPDVLMLHHMVPEAVADGSLLPNLGYYLPRTAHGSSLSPAVVASLLARAGRPNEALDWLRLAVRLDLDDLTGTTAGGIHLGTMGGAWQALTFGFLGTSVRSGVLTVDPRLPEAWSQVVVSLRVMDSPVTIRAGHSEAEIEAERPLSVRCGSTSVTRGARVRFVRDSQRWEEQ